MVTNTTFGTLLAAADDRDAGAPQTPIWTRKLPAP